MPTLQAGVRPVAYGIGFRQNIAVHQMVLPVCCTPMPQWVQGGMAWEAPGARLGAMI